MIATYNRKSNTNSILNSSEYLLHLNSFFSFSWTKRSCPTIQINHHGSFFIPCRGRFMTGYPAGRKDTVKTVGSNMAHFDRLVRFGRVKPQIQTANKIQNFPGTSIEFVSTFQTRFRTMGEDIQVCSTHRHAQPFLP